MTDFDDWIVTTFARIGAFTMLIFLVDIGENTVVMLRSSYLHVVGDDPRWQDMVASFTASGAAWNGAAFFQADRIGLVDDATARRRLAELGRHLEQDRSLLRHGELYNAQGLQMKIEGVTPH